MKFNKTMLGGKKFTKIQKTTRPGNIWVEDWPLIPPKDKRKAIADWRVQGPREKAARGKRQIWYIEAGDVADFKKTVADA